MKIIVFVPLVLVASVAVYGSDKPDLRACVEAAMRNSPERMRDAEDLRAAELSASAERRKQLLDGKVSANLLNPNKATSSSNPAFTAGAEASSRGPAGSTLSFGLDYGVTDDDDIRYDEFDFSAGVEIPIFANGRFIDPRISGAARRDVVDAPLAEAREKARRAECQSAAEIMKLALDFAAADRLYRVALKRAEIKEKEAELAAYKRKLGAMSYGDYLDAERDAESARLESIDARVSRDGKLRRLSFTTRIPPENIAPTVLVAPEVPSMVTLSESEKSGALSVLDARTSRENASDDLIIAGAQVAPRFGLSGNYTVYGPLSRDNDISAENSWGSTLSLSLPLPTGASSNQVRAAKARLAAAQAAETVALNESESVIAESLDKIAAAAARIDYLSGRLALARSREIETKTALSTENATELDAANAGLAVDEAEARLEDARTALFTAHIDLFEILGKDPRQLLSMPSAQSE